MRILLAGLLLVVVACGDSSGPGDDGGPADIAGSWTWAADVSNAGLSLTCVAAGSATISQSGSQFSGQIFNASGTCTGPGGSAAFDPNGAIGGGTIDENTVSFDDNFCEYTGTASGDPVNRVAGDVDCVFPISGQDIAMSGDWQMQR